MLKHKIISLVLILALLTIPTWTYARNVFGGLIAATKLPGVTCGAQYGPITIRSVRGPTGPYAIITATKSVGIGKWILGFYSDTMDTTICHTDADPPVPVPVYVIRVPFGVSR